MNRYRGAEGLNAMDRPATGDGDAQNTRPVALGMGLVIELDRRAARAVLLGSVEGQGRLVATSMAPSTAMPPIDDVAVAVKQVMRGIEAQTGMTLSALDGSPGQPDGDIRVNYLAVTGQPVAPVRLAVIPTGTSPVAAALAAAGRRTLGLIEVLGPQVRTADGVISGSLLEQRLRAFRPDAIVLAEGASIDAEWTTVTGTLASLVSDGLIGQVIIVAREVYQQLAAQLFGERADLRGIDPSEFAVEEIAAALEAELNAMYEARVGTSGALTATGAARYVNPLRAGDLVTRFLARRREQSVVAVTVADGVIVHRATGEQSDVLVRPDIDLGLNVRSALRLDAAAIACWLPFEFSAEDAAHWVLNRALRPFTIVDTSRDAAIEAAVTAAILRDVRSSDDDTSAIDMLVAGRPFTDWRSPAMAVFALLNAFQPSPRSGLVEIVLDREGLVPAAGALGEQSPALAADVVELDLAQPAASAIVVSGSGSEGSLAVRGQLRLAGGEVTRFTVPCGSVHRLPLPASGDATLTLSCEPGFQIGQHPSSDEVVFGATAPLRGAELGVIIDARGRPLQPATDASLYAARVASWLDDLGARI